MSAANESNSIQQTDAQSNGSSFSLLSQILILLVVLFSVFALTCLAAVLLNGSDRLIPITLAFVACLLAAILGQVLGEYPTGEMFIVSRLLSSSVVRVGVPIAMLTYLKLTESPWLELGMAYFVVLFYFVGLLTDLCLHLKRYRSVFDTSNSSSTASKNS